MQEYQVQRFRGGWAIVYPSDTATGRGRNKLTARSHGEALAEAARVWRAMKVGQGDTAGALVAAWLEAHKGLAANERNRNAWKAAAPFWRDVRASSINADVCRAYNAQRGRAARTVIYEIELVRRACYWAHREGLLATRPGFWLPPQPDREVRHLTKDQFRAFVEGCAAPHVRLFAMLAVATGGRATALLELQWDQVDFDRRIIRLNRPGRIQSHKRRATVPMNEQLHAALVEARRGAITPWVIEYKGARVASIKKGIAAAVKRSGVFATAHWFRHSAAVWMAEARVPMAEISQYLGHDNIRTTERIYARFSPDFLQGAAAALEW